jgi:predicted DNA binding CopG/RHH family protein
MIIQLIAAEITELQKTSPDDRRKGGFQSYIVELQERVKNREIDLSHEDLIKIDRYASYTSGGYQTRLKKIFGRTLGRYLSGLKRRK